MTQANQVLATIANPVNDWEILIEQDTVKVQEDVDIKPAKAKKKKATGTRRAERGRKKTLYRRFYSYLFARNWSHQTVKSRRRN